MLIGRVLAEEYAANNDPRSGSRSWFECHSFLCNNRCKGHGKSCALNHAIEFINQEILMPRSKKSKPQTNFSTTFVRCELTAEQKKQIAPWSKSKDVVLDDLVTEVLQSNHKISFSFSEHNDSFICSVTGKPEDCDNASKCYTSHAKDYTTALWVAMYKFHVVFDRGVWESVADEEDFG